jgi:PAS domain S-box-containing protein
MEPGEPQAGDRAMERLFEAQLIGRVGDWQYDLVDGTLSWSSQVFAITGHDPGLGPPANHEELGRLLGAAGADALGAMAAAALALGQAQDVELIVVRRGKEAGHVRVRAVPRADGHGTVLGLQGTVLDTSDRKRTERLVLESENRLGFALEAANIGDWDMDLRTDVARRSLRHDQCFGYAEALPEWGYATFLSHVSPVDRDRVDATFRAAMDGQGEYDVEFRVTWPDGTLHWLWSKGRFFFDETGLPYRVAGILADITARRQDVETTSRLAAIVASSEDAIVGMTLAGTVTSWNPGAERLFGHTAGEMIGRPIQDLARPEHRDQDTRAIAVVTAGGTVAPFEAPWRREDGTVIDVAVTMSPLRDTDGHVNGVSLIARDFGERKRMERALQHGHAAGDVALVEVAPAD